MRFPHSLIAALTLSCIALGQAASITLEVDASDAPRRILHARERIPATPGPLTLVYPKWIPGNHRPTGDVTNLTGLKFSAGGKQIPWRRDDVDMYAFHLDVPPSATAVDVELDYTSAAPPAGAVGIATSNLAGVSWHNVLLYPQGKRSDDLTFAASLKTPAGWKYGTSLEPEGAAAGDVIRFRPVSLTLLVDSPVVIGANVRRIPLTPGQQPEHFIDIVGETPASIEASPAQVQQWKNLVAETNAQFGAHHYQHYDFLLTLSDHINHFGLEHHQSSDNRVGERTVTDPRLWMLEGALLPHEMVHSWNGKYRRPAGLATPDYQEPMKGELLWVYEGLTNYLGEVLAARSGLWTPEQYREYIAWQASLLDLTPGRTWRPLQDTAVSVQLLSGSPPQWRSWRRGVDYYPESSLIWLEADALIRNTTGGAKSLNDFARSFYGPPSSGPMVKPYVFDDVLNAMNQVVPRDWRGFLRERLDSTAPRAPLGSIKAGGWKLVYNDQPNAFVKATEEDGITDLRYSVGLLLDKDGNVTDAIMDSPAYRAGIGPGMKMVAVNGRRYSPEVLKDAVKASKGTAATVELLMENREFFKTYRVDYRDGLKYPHLERVASKPDLLNEILKPVASARTQ